MRCTLPRYVRHFPVLFRTADIFRLHYNLCLSSCCYIPLSGRAVGKAPQFLQLCVTVLPSTGKATQSSPGLIFHLAIDMLSVSLAISVVLFSRWCSFTCAFFVHTPICFFSIFSPSFVLPTGSGYLSTSSKLSSEA